MNMRTFPGFSRWPSLSLIFADRHCVRWRVSIRSWPDAAHGGPSVDAYRDYVVRTLSKFGPHMADKQDLHIVFASRCLEQLADNAIRLAGNLVTFLEAQDDCDDRQQMAS